MLKHALVRKPCQRLADGLSTALLGKPDYPLACHQHENYIEALKTCGLEVTVLESDKRFPDSVFVEDVALLTPSCAVILNPGAVTRRGEVQLITPLLVSLFEVIKEITLPGTVDGGDILAVDSHYYIGQSKRTNRQGGRQLAAILSESGYTVSAISSMGYLHLKTGISYLENNILLMRKELYNQKDFGHFDVIFVDREEGYAANSIWVNDRVIMPAGFPRTKKMVEQAGYEVLEVEMSEFRKLDGGVSCLSLRY